MTTFVQVVARGCAVLARRRWRVVGWDRRVSACRAAAVVASACGALSANAQQVGSVQIASLGLSFNDNLTCVAQPPDDTRDLFAITQSGQLRLVRDGVLQVAPLVDLRPSLVPIFEAGLLGLAFHPRFQSNGFVYLCYVGYLPGSNQQQAGFHVVRYTLDPAEPTSVIPNSVEPVFFFERTIDSGHNGGWIGFGPDGFLYVSSGDGGGFAGSSQDPAIDFGKLLRIDVDRDDFPADPLANYAIPPTNPFFGSTTARPEVWAVGLRNPWRCSFDRLTGDLWIADVGQSAWEEIDFQPPLGPPPYAAVNYGWPCMEGPACNIYPGCVCGTPGFTPPAYAYPHPAAGAVIGGYVYRGAAIPSLQGAYFFADVTGAIWSFRLGPGGIMDLTDRTPELGSLGRTTFGEGSDGELYYGDARYPSGGGNPVGRVFKIVRPCPPNCDHSAVEPRLNVGDFICFMQRFAAGDSAANCDRSTTPPILDTADFVCYAEQFVAGCP
jgi:glucose/arabinose dehydrogenase